jgi:hypothetical protein
MSAPVVPLDEREQAVVLRPACRAHREVHGDAAVLRAGVVELDVAIDDRARAPAAGVAVIDRQQCFERDR